MSQMVAVALHDRPEWAQRLVDVACAVETLRALFTVISLLIAMSSLQCPDKCVEVLSELARAGARMHVHTWNTALR